MEQQKEASQYNKRSIQNDLGLSFHFLESGHIANIEYKDVRLNLKPCSLYSKVGSNIYLRKKGKKGYQYTPLLGPESLSLFAFGATQFRAQGLWEGIRYRCSLQLAESSTSWQWQIETENTNTTTCDLDLIYVQDVGLKPKNIDLVNTYYVSQYLERLLLEDPTYGAVVCCRQNFVDSDNTPWLQIACKNKAKSASTDGMQLYGTAYRKTGKPQALDQHQLGGEYAGELSIVALQEAPFSLASKQTHQSTFVGIYQHHHPEITSPRDLEHLPQRFKKLEDEKQEIHFLKPVPPKTNLFNNSPFLPVQDLDAEEIDRYFAKEKRHIEEKNGQILSFFYGKNQHVVLQQKEVLVDRPHGHIMQSASDFTPEENIVSTTSYACGVFNSHTTQGNTNFNRLLSVYGSALSLETETGQRIFASIGKQTYLLGIPSAFEMGLNHCRWLYKTASNCIQVRTWTSQKDPQIHLDIQIIEGDPIDLLLSNQLDPTVGWQLEQLSPVEVIATPNAKSLIASKYRQPQFRIIANTSASTYSQLDIQTIEHCEQEAGVDFCNFAITACKQFVLHLVGEVQSTNTTTLSMTANKLYTADHNAAQNSWKKLASGLELENSHRDITVLQDILPWYGSNALTHVLTPHGLEQFEGAAWGTRDITQGPFELLLSTQKTHQAKHILRLVFSHQNPDGTWPQWWMFDRYAEIRAGSSHGDIHHWCIVALAKYIQATEDIAFLDEALPYYTTTKKGGEEKESVLAHLERLIDMLVGSFIAGTALVPFGGGDWNDSMQPANKALADRLVSSWTVALNYQAFTAMVGVYELMGKHKKAKKLASISKLIRADFNRYLIRDGVVAGLGYLESDQNFRLLLHPSDKETNIQYRLLPMIRGIISGIFSKEQATNHLALIATHLKGPDGARLMNIPPTYNGGIQTIFQRAESSTFFGREIGMMYMHAHLRYAESLARMGDAAGFLKALRQANPIAYQEVVSCGDLRQANCYFSSSDIIFPNRYKADQDYASIREGKQLLKGGWRIYSSGPGIFIGLVVWHFLGLRTEYGKTIIDPMIPKHLDGLRVKIQSHGYPLELHFRTAEDTHHPKKIKVNGQEISFTYTNNPYRNGGAVLETKKWLELLNDKENRIEIVL
ncbi:MAG: hypothetical protein OIF50_09735 [Flavobacteriaceae bacterium]|nr:hypothetical protein [Flavobacteriaceae bacterium]